MSYGIGSSRLYSQAATTRDDFPQPLEPTTARYRRSSTNFTDKFVFLRQFTEPGIQNLWMLSPC
jgi:hypothetical protein